MVFNYKPQARIKASAQIAGEVCQQLEMTGGLTPKRLLEASRDENTPLHEEFEWDDAIAAESYREQQAAYIIRNIVIQTTSEEKKPVRAFFNVANDDAREYRSLDVIINTPTLRDRLFESAKNEMQSFKDKYESLCELTPVFSAIDNVLIQERR
jgi:thioredoxin reductase